MIKVATFVFPKISLIFIEFQLSSVLMQIARQSAGFLLNTINIKS